MKPIRREDNWKHTSSVSIKDVPIVALVANEASMGPELKSGKSNG